MSLRGPDWRARLGRLIRRWIACCLLASTTLWLGVGCVQDPPRREPVHVVKQGENLYRIAKRYGVSVEELKRANGIRDVTNVQIGTRLRIPSRSGTRVTKQAAPAPKRQTQFRWPVRGKLMSKYGRRNGRPHEGIDLAASPGTPIYAAAPGRVIYSDNGLGGYGNVVIIKHERHFTTVYAHNRKNRVRYGQFVERGDHIADVGQTGRASGPHLHFEIRARKKPVDPLGYLP